MDASRDPEIVMTVREIFNAVIEEFNVIGEKIDETTD
jgi:hypothetical protein